MDAGVLKKIKMKKITSKILKELLVIQTLTKLLYCSSSKKTTMFLV